MKKIITYNHNIESIDINIYIKISIHDIYIVIISRITKEITLIFNELHEAIFIIIVLIFIFNINASFSAIIE